MRRMKNLHIMCEDPFRQTSCNLSASAIKKPSEEKLKFTSALGISSRTFDLLAKKVIFTGKTSHTTH